MKLQKIGGFASVVLALVNIAYYILDRYFMFTAVDKGSGNEAVMMITAYRTSTVAFNVFYATWIVGSITYLLIAYALQERMQAKATHWMRLAVIAASVTSALNLTAFISGFLRYRLLAGTGDLSAYRSALKMFDFLTLTSVHTWGWALVLIGCAALITRALPRLLSWFILVDGIIELTTFVFFGTSFELPLWYADMVMIIVSMMWLGVVLWREHEPNQAKILAAAGIE